MQNSDLELIKLNSDHLEELTRISRSTYSNSFSVANKLENMRHYLDFAFNAEKISHELLESDSEFYFAKLIHETAGYLKLNFGKAQTDLREINGMELERIYVLEKFQGQNIGTILMAFAVEKAEERSLEYVWLGVWDKNEKAIEFYKRNGFEIIGSHPFIMGNEIQTDLIMRRNI